MLNKHFAKKIGAVSAAALVGTQAQAADWSATTGAIDFSGEITAVIAIVGVLASVAVAMVGGRKVLSMLGR